MLSKAASGLSVKETLKTMQNGFFTIFNVLYKSVFKKNDCAAVIICTFHTSFVSFQLWQISFRVLHSVNKMQVD